MYVKLCFLLPKCKKQAQERDINAFIAFSKIYYEILCLLLPDICVALVLKCFTMFHPGRSLVVAFIENQKNPLSDLHDGLTVCLRNSY